MTGGRPKRHVPVAAVSGFAPGRCTLVGEHVDYADGAVVCVAVDLGITVGLQDSADGMWHVRSGDRAGRRADLAPARDVGDLPLATVLALRRRGVSVPAAELRIEATLPESAGLSSSAALCGAVAVAVLRRSGSRLAATDLAEAMLHAERDIVGVPCGPLDQRAVVLAPRDGALLLDCRDGSAASLPWLEGHVLVACHTGGTHDVGGAGYRARRSEAAQALRAMGRASYRDVSDIRGATLDEVLRRRARHIVTETQRALQCADALRGGDAARVGLLMSQSHASLRDDYEVSTRALDAVVAAAQASAGCLGARLCGAGFGGTAVALVEEGRARVCLDAMQAVLPAAARGRGAWVLRPAPGIAELAPDVVHAG